MPLRHKAIDVLVEADLQKLVANAVQEGKTIEYKRDLPGDGPAKHKEFLADATSFANASGGDILFGVSAAAGIATVISGLSVPDTDQEILRLDGMLRSGVDPRYTFQIASIPIATGRNVIVLRIPRSWSAPHRVIYQNSSRFWSRTSAGKYELDVAELRAAFVGSETAAERIRQFRAERLLRIISGDVPSQLNRPLIAVHVVPVNAFSPGIQIPWPLPRASIQGLTPLYLTGSNPRYNFDGYLLHHENAYTQVFRNGAVEGATDQLGGTGQYAGTLPSGALVNAIVAFVEKSRAMYATLGIAVPLVVMVTLLGVAGHVLHLQFVEGHQIDREDLLVPDILIEDETVASESVLRPAFDAIWNACGLDRCSFYDADGRWTPPR